MPLDQLEPGAPRAVVVCVEQVDSNDGPGCCRGVVVEWPHLICTDQLLDTRARNVEEMELISALCSFVEWAG